MYKRSLVFVLIMMVELFASSSTKADAPSEQTSKGFLLDLELDQIMKLTVVDVQSAGFFTMSSAKAPGNTTAINAERIRAGSAIRLRDIYEMYAPGVHIGEHIFNLTLYGSRGLTTDNNAKTLFMFDGQPINFRMHGFSTALEWPFLNDLNTIEIVNGPGAIAHGSGAISGFVFLTPKNGTDYEGGDVAYTYGFKEKLHRFEASQGIVYGPKKDLFLYAGYATAEGFAADSYHHIEDPTLHFDQPVWGARRPSYKVGAYWNHGNFHTNLMYVEMNLNIPSVLTNEKEGNNDKGTLLFSPRYTFNLSDTETLEARINTAWQDNVLKGYHPPDRTERGNRESHYETRLTYRTQKLEHHALAMGGLVGKRYFRPSSSYFSDDPQSYIVNAEGDWNEYGAYFEDIIQLTDKWTASLGSRYDMVDYEGIQITPVDANYTVLYDSNTIGRSSSRAATAYEFSKGHTVKASFQQGFHYPDLFDIGLRIQTQDGLREVGGDLNSLKPESFDSIEVGLTNEFKESRVTLTTNLYHNTYYNQLQYSELSPKEIGGQAVYDRFVEQFDRTPSTMSNNPRSIRSIGGEFVASWGITDGLKFDLAYGYAKPRGINDESDPGVNLTTMNRSEWLRYPKHQIKSGITSFHLNRSLILNANVVWASGVDDYTTNLIDDSLLYRNQDRTQVDVAATYYIVPQLYLKLVGRNVLGDDAPRVSFYTNTPQAGNLGNRERMWYFNIGSNF